LVSEHAGLLLRQERRSKSTCDSEGSREKEEQVVGGIDQSAD
jgi:hypothetical protein